MTAGGGGEIENSRCRGKNVIREKKGAGARIRFWAKPGSGALHLKQREIFKSLLNEYFR